MANLYLMTTIVDRKAINKYLDLYRENDLHVMYLTLGYGTVSSEILDYFGLDSKEKAVAFSVMQDSSWENIKIQLQKKLKIRG